MSETIWPRNADLEAAIAHLISVEHWQDASYVRLPMVYPGGSHVTVQVSMMPGGRRYRVTDGGFGFQELEDIGAERSFKKTAAMIAANLEVSNSDHNFLVDVNVDELTQAISDIGMASWQLVSRVYAKQREEVDPETIERLAERLERIFRAPVESLVSMSGASTTPWEMTALVKRGSEQIVFQSVNANGNSIHRANSAFDDLSDLDDPPKLVAVVPSFDVIGPKLKLLARRAKVIQLDEPDEYYLRAAA